MPSEAPSWCTRASFPSLLDVAMTRAPNALANWSAKSETPPVPWMSTVSPALMLPAKTSACAAVTAAHGSVAPSSSVCCRRPFRQRRGLAVDGKDRAEESARSEQSHCTTFEGRRHFDQLTVEAQ